MIQKIRKKCHANTCDPANKEMCRVCSAVFGKQGILQKQLHEGYDTAIFNRRVATRKTTGDNISLYNYDVNRRSKLKRYETVLAFQPTDNIKAKYETYFNKQAFLYLISNLSSSIPQNPKQHFTFAFFHTQQKLIESHVQ